MRLRGRFDLPADLEPVMARAKVLEWLTLTATALASVGMYFALGSSQTMKAAWIEDMLSLAPPATFLIAARFRHRSPNATFPYGHHRAVSVSFLGGAVALALFGLLILSDSLTNLLAGHHPSIGGDVIAGQVFWAGWLMIAMLLATSVAPFVLGRLKLPLAVRLNDKALKADAQMNKADWQTAVAGILGIVGIGLGFWWADAAAGVFISAGIVKDGFQNLREAVASLMDRSPTTLDGDSSDVPDRVRMAVEGLPWVVHADVRMREQGHVFAGELFLTITDGNDLWAKTLEARRTAAACDWRVHDVVVELHQAQPQDRPPACRTANGVGGKATPRL